jgi:hypothetical protein
MLSTKARHLLKISEHAVLPVSMDDLYDHWFAGRSYRTRFDRRLEPRWIFKRREELEDGIYVDCLEHYTAQFYFGLDSSFRVCVKCRDWVPIASSFVSLVETDALLEASPARKDQVLGLGRFRSQDEFMTRCADHLIGFHDIGADPDFARVLQGPKSLVVSSRFYSDEPRFNAVEYPF